MARDALKCPRNSAPLALLIWTCCLVVGIAEGTLTGGAFAETVVLVPYADNSIHRDWEDFCGTYAPDYPDLVVQAREDLPSVVRSLLIFDISPVPANAAIVSATLRLYCLFETEYETNDFHLSRIAEPWNALAVTWCERDAGLAWCVGGGCLIRDGETAVRIPTKYPDPWAGGPYDAWVEWDATRIVDAWHLGIGANFGMCLWQTPQPGHRRSQRVHFAAVDHPESATLGPRLVVEYQTALSIRSSTWGQVKSLFRLER